MHSTRNDVKQRKATDHGFSPSLTPRTLPATTPATTSCNTGKQRVRLPTTPSGVGLAIQKTSLEPSLTTPTCSATRKSRTASNPPNLAASWTPTWFSKRRRLARWTQAPSASTKTTARTMISQRQSALREYSIDHPHSTYGTNKSDSYDFNDLITILVGEEEHHFKAHKDMLCAKSKFFKAACSKVWASGREKVVRQPEGAPEDFQIYVEWVYTSKLSLDADGIEKQQARLMDLYILGDSIDNYQLRNATMKRLIANTRKGIQHIERDQVHKVYAATTTGSALRQFLVNWILTCFSRDAIKLNIAQEPSEFVQELAVAAMEQIAPTDDDEAFEFLTVMFEREKDSG